MNNEAREKHSGTGNGVSAPVRREDPNKQDSKPSTEDQHVEPEDFQPNTNDTSTSIKTRDFMVTRVSTPAATMHLIISSSPSRTNTTPRGVDRLDTASLLVSIRKPGLSASRFLSAKRSASSPLGARGHVAKRPRTDSTDDLAEVPASLTGGKHHVMGQARDSISNLIHSGKHNVAFARASAKELLITEKETYGTRTEMNAKVQSNKDAVHKVRRELE
ncbi:hypothetical protein FDECE_13535 [Fusarium decemcellulare]|nr:hypothetical protein FDECE_13535 [Fusarium decemcellulare]